MINFAVMFFAALSLASGSEEFDRTAAEGAARIVIGRVKEDLRSNPFAVEDLKNRMLSQSAKAAKRADAEKMCRELYFEMAKARLQEESKSVLTRLAGDQGADKAFSADFTKEARSFNAEDEKRMMSGAFVKAFELARKGACEEQARKIALKIRPSMAEADRGNDGEMRKSLTDRIALSQSGAVFEENLGYISEKIVAPIIEDAKKEKRRQSEYVRRTRSDASAPSALTADIAEKLVANVKSRKEKTKEFAVAWDVFPSVTNATLRNTVEKRIDDRFAENALEIGFEVRKEDIAKIILSDKKAHRKACESERIVESKAGDKLFAAVLDILIREAREEEREELRTYLERRKKAKKIAKAIDSRVKEIVHPVWKVARKEIVEKEFEDVWPRLADSTWYPDVVTADDICSRSDFAAVARDWRKLPSLSELHVKGAVMEESDLKADAKVKDAFELARVALVAQTRIVEDEMPKVLAEAIEKKESFWTRTPKLADIVTMLTRATEDRWNETRQETLWRGRVDKPENADEHHAEIFPSVKRKIELVARTVFEEMKKDPKDRNEKEKEENPELPPDDENLCTISFKRDGSSITIKASKDGKTIVERKAPLTAKGFEKAFQDVGEAVGKEVFRLKKTDKSR